MPLVTVPGVAAGTIELQFQTPENTFRAEDLLSPIEAARRHGKLVVENAPTVAASGPGLFEYTIGDAGGQRGAGPTDGTVPRGWRAIVDGEFSAVPARIVGANQADETVVAAGSLRFFTKAGSGTLVSAQGNNVITAPKSGGGDWSLFFDSGSNTVLASSGNFLIQTDTDVTFGQNLLTLGSGNDTVMSWGQDTIDAGPGGNNLIALLHAGSVYRGDSGTSVVVDRGGADTVVQGVGAETVFAAAANGLYRGGGGGLTFVSAAAASGTVVAGTGDATLYAGPHSDFTFLVGAGRFVLDGGSGDQTVAAAAGVASGGLLFAESGGAMNLVGAAANTLIAGAGAVTLNGASASGDNVYFAGTGSDRIVAGAGADTVVAGPGTDTLVGGGGLTTFVLDGAVAPASHELIGNWTTLDQLDLIGYGAPTAPGGLPGGAVLSPVEGSSLLSLPDGTQITFVNAATVATSQLHFF